MFIFTSKQTSILAIDSYGGADRERKLILKNTSQRNRWCELVSCKAEKAYLMWIYSEHDSEYSVCIKGVRFID
jgi:hypothetical protein